MTASDVVVLVICSVLMLVLIAMGTGYWPEKK